MTLKMMIYCLLVGLMVGCATVSQRGAMVNDGMIKNSSLGFFGFSFAVPEGFDLYDPAPDGLKEYTEVQQMAIRIYELNESYHPRGTETFYESFLMLSETTGFLLITVENDSMPEFNSSWSDDSRVSSQQLMPLYNVSDSRRIMLGDGRMEALIAKGRVYERKGWYYSKSKSKRLPVCYEACKVGGVNRDSYILMGFSFPEYEHILFLQMQEAIRGFRF